MGLLSPSQEKSIRFGEILSPTIGDTRETYFGPNDMVFVIADGRCRKNLKMFGSIGYSTIFFERQWI